MDYLSAKGLHSMRHVIKHAITLFHASCASPLELCKVLKWDSTQKDTFLYPDMGGGRSIPVRSLFFKEGLSTIQKPLESFQINPSFPATRFKNKCWICISYLDDCGVHSTCKYLQYMSVFSQDEFPKSQKDKYPGWVYAIIVILAGVPSLAIPLTAIYKGIQSCLKKQDGRQDLINAVSEVSINGELRNKV